MRRNVPQVALLLSLFLHFLFLIVIYYSSRNDVNERKPIIIDFRISHFEQVDNRVGRSAEENNFVSREVRSAEARDFSVSVKSDQSQSEIFREIKTENKAEMEPVRESSKGLSGNTKELAKDDSKIGSQKINSETGLGIGSDESSKKRSFSGDRGGEGKIVLAEDVSHRYLRENFQYIRDIIAKNTFYPPLARRMGWTGKVTLSFIVAEDGTVRDIQIVERSGYEVLDRSAVETVRRSAPFPRPPVAVKIILPIVYKLN